MCLAVPARVIERRNDEALVEIAGVVRGASLALTPEAKEGDWVLVHAGYAIEIVDETAAEEALSLRQAGFAILDEGAAPESVGGAG